MQKYKTDSFFLNLSILLPNYKGILPGSKDMSISQEQ